MPPPALPPSLPLSLNTYIASFPPTPSALLAAHRLFDTSHLSTTRSIHSLFKSAKFRTLPLTSVPEILLIGRSNVGKSSLLNALLGRPTSRLASVSKKPGHTRALEGFPVGPSVRCVRETVRSERRVDEKTGRVSKASTARVSAVRGVDGMGLVVVDSPGYGHGSLEGWGVEVVKYLGGRKMLRRAMLLVDSTTGITDMDAKVLDLLSETTMPYQIVLTKVDKLFKQVPADGQDPLTTENLEIVQNAVARVRKRLEKGEYRPLDSILCTASALHSLDRREGRVGIGDLRYACMQAASIQLSAKRRKDDDDFFEGIQVIEDI